MSHSTLDNGLWAASLIGHVALVLILLLRGRVRHFPVFSSFVFFSAVRTILLFFVYRYGSHHQYFLAYWITGGGDYLFQVALIVEIARKILRPTGHWVFDSRRAFLLWAAFGLVVAALMALKMGPPQSRGLAPWEARITLFTSLMTCGLFLAMVRAANELGLRWRDQVFAIGQGLFLWAFISLVEDVAHTALGWNRDFALLNHVRMFAYLAVLLFWCIRFWRPEPERAELSPEIRAYLVAAHDRLQYDLSSKNRLQP